MFTRSQRRKAAVLSTFAIILMITLLKLHSTQNMLNLRVPLNDSIFFIETNDQRKELSNLLYCSMESAARHNPERLEEIDVSLQ
jgi:hypothetical protein